ncbi:MAG: hypothetical protein GWN58_25215, partial [Anaerolineae bacterium]|nr:hypothetical protein [Anaerolineae bacterium]
MLVLANSAHRLQLFGLAFDENEDWQDMNALSEAFGVVFENGTLSASRARTEGGHPLTEGQASL